MVFILIVWHELDPILPYIFFKTEDYLQEAIWFLFFHRSALGSLGNNANSVLNPLKTTEKVHLREMSAAELLTVTK